MTDFATQAALGCVLVLLSLTLHAGGLVLIADLLRAFSGRLRTWHRNLGAFVLLATGLCALLVLHALGIWLWAATYLGIGASVLFADALLLATSTAALMDHVAAGLAQQWRLLNAFQGVTSLLTFGASAAFLLDLIRRLLGGERG